MIEKCCLYSIIIPHKNSIDLLSVLLSSIPDTPDYEVLIVDDNSDVACLAKLHCMSFNANVRIFYNTKSGGAGKARNIGLRHAIGEWILFADADDFFVGNMPSILTLCKDSDADIVYFYVDSIYLDTMQTAYRHERYIQLIDDYLESPSANGDKLRFYFTPPWGKLYRRSLLVEHQFFFEEILTGNDMMFSLQTAWAARKIEAYRKILYTVTVSQGSLTTTMSRPHFESRFQAVLRCNDFLRTIGKPSYQMSVLYFLIKSYRFGLCYICHVIGELGKHRSNIFIGLKKIFSFNSVLQDRENIRFLVVKK